MQQTDQLKQDLEYVAGAVRRQDRAMGVPAIYFMWAAIGLVGSAALVWAGYSSCRSRSPASRK